MTPTLSARPSLAGQQREGTPFENFILGGDYGTQYRLELRAKSTALFDLAVRLGDTHDPGELFSAHIHTIECLNLILG